MAEASTLYFNATVHTLNGGPATAEAILVQGDRILAVGRHADLEGPNMERIDLQGQSVVPGFNDSHCHVLSLGLTLAQIDVSADAVQSIADIQRAVAHRVAQTAAGEWVLGRGYDQNMLTEARHPTRRDLDEVAPDHPVLLRHTSGHALTCNSAALNAVGVHAGTDNPPGGEIDRDEHGEPTGVLKETAMDLVADAIPEPSVEDGARAVADAMRLMACYGITSASDAATGWGSVFLPTVEMYQRAAADGPAVRVTLMPEIHFVAPPDSDKTFTPRQLAVDADPLWLRIGSAKIFSDGALSTRTAAMCQPYAGSSDTGILLWPQPTLEDMIERAHRAGWHIAVHALGDRAIEAVLDGYERALRAHPRTDHRHRIEHCMVVDEGLAQRIARLGVVPSLQPDIFRLGDGYIAAMGTERAAQTIPMVLFKRFGIRVAFSSDSPVVPCDPLRCIRSAMERKTPAGVVLGQEHAVSSMEAIRNYTVGGAYATHLEAEKGTIQPGKLADFAVLSADPAGTPPAEFASIRVTMTVAGGRITYTE